MTAFTLSFIVLVVSLLAQVARAGDTGERDGTLSPPFLVENDPWVDSVYNSMTLDQKIGQLFMVAAYSNRDSTHTREIARLIQEYHVGGLIFMQGGPVRQARLTNYYQSVSKVPLMVSIDGEWGLSMRLDSTMSFPKQMQLGAIQDDSLIFQMGKIIARQCRRIGVTINFAPDIDVNNNPANPVIGMRSFGEDKENVARKGLMYMKGMQSEHVLCTGKHFPGHGDTDVDSHVGLPVVRHTRQRLDTLELYPFARLINSGLTGVMVAHMQVNSLDKTKNTPTTLSPLVINTLLKKHMGFKGLVFTDALNMKGVANLYKPGEVDLRALKAGNDVLLFSEDVPAAVAKIKQALATNDVDSTEVFGRCRKILMAKKWMNLHQFEPVNIENMYDDLSSLEAKLVNRRLVEASITVVKNKGNILPLKRLDTLRVASLSVGDVMLVNKFQERLQDYTKVTHFRVGKNPSDSVIKATIESLKSYNLVIVSVNGTNIFAAKHFGITSRTVSLVSSLSKTTRVVMALFASPYALALFKDIDHVDAIVLGYEDKELQLDYAAQAIFGGIKTPARLPVSVPGMLKAGQGKGWTEATRVRYSIPEDVGMSSDTLSCIDYLAEHAIDMGATPGCQILVARNNTVVFRKSFGYHTYQKIREVNDSDLYDIASITKIVASAPSLMRLTDAGVFSVDDPMCVYLPGLDSSNKADLCAVDILTHQAGLKSWIPFYLSLVKGYDNPGSKVVSSYRSETHSVNSGVYGQWLDDNYAFQENALCNTWDSTFSVQVASNVYLNTSWKDTIYERIKRSRLSLRKEYVYSDLGYYMFQQIIEDRTRMRLDSFVSRTFFEPLGANMTGYLPLRRFNINGIVPTEIDVVFRKQLLQGHVHDPGAAMLGGVAGHAGVFSNANDLVKIMQMYLNKGEYGGERYLSEAVMNRYVSCEFCPTNHRGISFDKISAKQSMGPVCRCASLSSFGHTGFTGTICWVDPEYQLVYIFLSNRVHPDAENSKLNKLTVRQGIQQSVYNAMRIK